MSVTLAWEQEAQTRVIKSTLNPVWDQEFTFDMVEGGADCLLVQVPSHACFLHVMHGIRNLTLCVVHVTLLPVQITLFFTSTNMWCHAFSNS